MIPRLHETWTLGELAAALGRSWRGDEAATLEDAADLASATGTQLACLYDARRIADARASAAGALIAAEAVAEALPSRNLIFSPAPKADFARAMELLRPLRPLPAGVHPTAVVAEDAELGERVHIGAQAVISSGCKIGEGSLIGAGSVLLEGVELGPRVEIHPRVVLYPGTIVGEGSLILAGAVIGAPGFGQAHDESGRAVRVPHLGRVVLGREVEIGANTTVDRASFGETRIADRAKLDNLVQIGHNAVVGEDAMVAAQSGLAGSSSLGRGVRVGGQSGLADHVHVGGGSAVAAKSAVFHSVEEGEVVAGIPAQPIGRWRRMVSVQGKLPELWAEVRRWARKEKDSG